MIRQVCTKSNYATLFVLFALSLTGCKTGPAAFPSAKEVAKNPPIAPLGQTDISDPQAGYLHAPSGINSGDFYLARAGTSRRASLEKVSSLSRILFYRNDKVNDLPIGFGFCSFKEKSENLSSLEVPQKTWTCYLFKDQVDAQAAYFSESAPLWPVNTVICINCIPQPVPALDRMCPGYYLSWLKPETWEDPTYPGDITKFGEDGNCIHNKPWFRVKESE